MNLIIKKTTENVIECLRGEIEKCANSALSARGTFRVGLSGGSVLNYLISAIPRIDSDCSKWKFFFCDERFVKESDENSSFGTYKRKLLPAAPALNEQQFISINTNLTLEKCALDYEQKILQEFELESGAIPEFDLLLLGMGPDGHTCSLFPEHALLSEQKRLIAAISDSPKPPPERVTMTFPLINNAKLCIFAICGSDKAEMVKRVFKDKEQLPAAMVKPKNGTVLCIFDEGAAKLIS